MPTREYVGAWTGGTRAQAGHLAPARSERAENPQGLTGRARVARWRTRRTTERVDHSGRGDARGRCRAVTTASRNGCCDCWAKRACRSDMPHDAATRLTGVSAYCGSCRRGLAARRAEARGTVTRMGRDRASGLGSPKATRARSRQGRALPTGPASTAWSALGPASRTDASDATVRDTAIHATGRAGRIAHREGREREGCEVAGGSRGQSRDPPAASAAPPASCGGMRRSSGWRAHWCSELERSFQLWAWMAMTVSSDCAKVGTPRREPASGSRLDAGQPAALCCFDERCRAICGMRRGGSSNPALRSVAVQNEGTLY